MRRRETPSLAPVAPSISSVFRAAARGRSVGPGPARDARAGAEENDRIRRRRSGLRTGSHHAWLWQFLLLLSGERRGAHEEQEDDAFHSPYSMVFASRLEPERTRALGRLFSLATDSHRFTQMKTGNRIDVIAGQVSGAEVCLPSLPLKRRRCYANIPPKSGITPGDSGIYIGRREETLRQPLGLGVCGLGRALWLVNNR